MDRDRLILGLAAVFAGLTVVLVVLAFVTQPFLLFVALPFGATTYLMWSHATGRLAERTRQRTAAGVGRTREPRGDPTARREWQPSRSPGTRPSRREALRTLGLSPGASSEEIRRAYRARVKEVHPDAETGDRESFKRVVRAYERLTKQ